MAHSGNGENGASGHDGGRTVEDLMRYDLLVEHALKQVVQHALARVARSGLPGGHHFYIAFDTRHEGVRMSDRLRQKYPEEMTIVLQHQFWDLKAYPDRFEVGLSFGGIPERLIIPFDALTGFYDPHVQFALQFRKLAPEEERVIADDVTTGEEGGGSPASAGGEEGAAAPDRADATGSPAEGASDEEKAAKEGEKEKEKIVSLDAFRKKK